MRRLTIVLIVVGLFFALGLIERKACNKSGSLAEKINWAGHNCPRK